MTAQSETTPAPTQGPSAQTQTTPAPTQATSAQGLLRRLRIDRLASDWFSGGLSVIFSKELADQVRGIRFTIMFLLVGAASLSAMYVAAQSIRQTVAEQGSEFIFLRLFTTGTGSLPPFIAFLSFLGPLVGMAMGFDAIVAERNRGTLSRLLSQPIYRDDVINGKFLAGIASVALMMLSLGFLVAGLGLILTGIPPSTEEIARVAVYLLVSVVYVAFWLALAILFSVVFRHSATSALAGIAVWLFFVVFARLLVGLAVDSLFPAGNDAALSQALRHARWEQSLNRISPVVLYDEVTVTLLMPAVRTLGPVLLEQVEGAIPGAPLSIGQSLLLIWPQVTSLIALTLVLFAAAYYLFLRQEVRA